MRLFCVVAAIVFGVIAVRFGEVEPAFKWSGQETVAVGDGSVTRTVQHAVPNEVSGRAALGFAIAAGLSVVAAAVVGRGERREVG